MARTGWVKPQDDQRLTDHVALGVLTRTFPPELVDEVISVTGRSEQRSRLLPARLVLYYVLALALFANSGYEEVMRSLVEGLSWAEGWRHAWTVPTKAAIFRARSRLGVEPVEELFRRACVPLGTLSTPDAFYRGKRLVSMDGTTLDVADTAANAAAFGRPAHSRGEGAAFPQVRLVALAECGTHAIFAVKAASFSTGETTMACELVSGLDAGMLLLADRGFASQPLFEAAAATGADLLWRTRSNAVLPVLERLSDGSYRSEIVGSTGRRRREHVTPVRVVEYALADPGLQAEDATYRLLTTLLDPAVAPARELAALYAQRWEFETALDELKTHQRGPRVVLRSKTPEGVRQEVYGHLCTHYAIRALMSNAAHFRDVDPNQISFTRSLHAARRSVRQGLGVTGRVLALALTVTIGEICAELLPRRRLRSAARVVKRKMSGYRVKRDHHRRWPQPTMIARDAVRILSPP